MVNGRTRTTTVCPETPTGIIDIKHGLNQAARSTRR